MGDVTLTIGDRRHVVACREGEEPQMRRLGEMIDARWAGALRAAGGMSGERAMLFVALMLADALDETQRRPGGDADAAFAAHIADRLEKIAATLEQHGLEQRAEAH